MSSKNPDIVHLEDDLDKQEYVQFIAKKDNQKTYQGYANLEAFMEAMKIDDKRPTLGYILDGRFPKAPNEGEQFLLPNAIKFLRETIADSSRIVIHSSSLESEIMKHGLLDKPEIYFVPKSTRTKPQDVIDQLLAA